MLLQRFLKEEIYYDGEKLELTLMKVNRKTVFLKAVPGEYDDEVLIKRLKEYGNVLSIKALTLRNYPYIKTATRQVEMELY